VLTSLSAVLSTLDAGSFAEGVFRLAAPMVAAWLWERGMAVERRRTTGRRINWRITPERILVRLGVAEGTDRAASEVDVHRRLSRLARAAKRARALQAAGARGWRQGWAHRRLDAAMDAAVEHAGLAADTGRQDALMGQIGALYNAAMLADLAPRAPWDRTPAMRLVRRPVTAARPDWDDDETEDNQTDNDLLVTVAESGPDADTEPSGDRQAEADTERPRQAVTTRSETGHGKRSRRRTANGHKGGRKRRSTADMEADAVAVLSGQPGISGADLGRAIGVSPRTGRRLRSRVTSTRGEVNQ
jgi:hypothetical protein